MTEISKLGEFGLIHRLTDNIKIKNESTIKGVGDDCAVLHYPDSEVLDNVVRRNRRLHL